MPQSPLLQTALDFVSIGISTMPCKEKFPLDEWSKYQDTLITEQEVSDIFSLRHYCKNIAIICGDGSGGIEVIDFDKKNYRPGHDIFEEWSEIIKDHDPALYESLPVERSPGGGCHVYYRCEEIEGNQVIASWFDQVASDLWKSNPSNKELEYKKASFIKNPIETRGRGGLIVCHPSPKYVMIQGDLFSIPNISPYHRDLLFAVARTFNEIETEDEVNQTKKEKSDFKWNGIHPFDDYNERGNPLDIMVKHGFTIVPSGKNKKRPYTGTDISVYESLGIDRVSILRPGETSSKTSGNYHVKKKRLRMYSSATSFKTDDANKKRTDKGIAHDNVSIFCVLECAGDKKVAFKKLLEMGFGSKSAPDPEIISQHQSNGIDNNANIPFSIPCHPFWFLDSKKRLNLSVKDFASFLNKTIGIHLYRTASVGVKNIIMIRVIDNIIEEIDIVGIKEISLKYLSEFPSEIKEGETFIKTDLIIAKLISDSYKYFCKDVFEFLPIFNPEIYRDTKEHACLFFKNTAVKITSDNITPFSYAALPGHIWKTQIVDRNYSFSNKNECQFDDFIKKVSNTGGTDDVIAHKYLLFKSVYGYLIHGFKNPSTPWSIVLNDVNISEGEEGGTGKGIFATSLSHILPLVIINGKDINKNDSRFQYQDVNLDTRILFFDDVSKNFDFKSLFSDITTGMKVEKKNQSSIYLPYVISPKYIISTNYALSGNFGSHKRRRIELEFSSFFGPSHTPADQYKGNLFDDFSPSQWNEYDNFCINCVQSYLKNGIPTSQTLSVDRKRFVNQTSDDFFQFWEQLNKNGDYVKTELYHKFITMAGTTKFFTQNLFTKWIKLGFDYSGLIYSDFKRGDHLYYSFQKNIPQPIPILTPENINTPPENISNLSEKHELFDNEDIKDNMPDF